MVRLEWFACGALSLVIPFTSMGCANLPFPKFGASVKSNNAMVSMAQLHESQGHLEPAQKLYVQLHRRDPNNAEYPHRVAILCSRLGDHSTAAQFFDYAYRLDPQNADLMADIGYAAYLRGDHAAAEQWLQAANTATPGDVRISNNLGLVQGLQGKFTESIATFSAVCGESGALSNLAYIHVQRGETQLAQQRYQEALNRNPKLKPANEALEAFKTALPHQALLAARPLGEPEVAGKTASLRLVSGDQQTAIKLELPADTKPTTTRRATATPSATATVTAAPATSAAAIEHSTTGSAASNATPPQTSGTDISQPEATPAAAPERRLTALDRLLPVAAQPQRVAHSAVMYAGDAYVLEAALTVAPRVDSSTPRGGETSEKSTASSANLASVAAPITTAANGEQPKTLPAPVTATEHTDAIAAQESPRSAPTPWKATSLNPTPAPAPPADDDFQPPIVGYSAPRHRVAQAVETRSTSRSEYQNLRTVGGVSTAATLKPEIATDELAGVFDDTEGSLAAPRRLSETEEESVASRAKRLQSRQAQSGFKGFCPVALRDRGQMVNADAQFQTVHHSQTYTFSSEAALAQFLSDPDRYAPVAGGLDVVAAKEEQAIVQGSLDFAIWHRGKLYFFVSEASKDAFMLNPALYLGK